MSDIKYGTIERIGNIIIKRSNIDSSDGTFIIPHMNQRIMVIYKLYSILLYSY